MAIFRKIHTSFWSDSFVSELEKEKKLFYIYLLTNERTRQCGVYEITKKQIAFDLGYSIDTVSKLLEYFIKHGKIRYNSETFELAIGNWLKYNSSTSPKVQQCINKELTFVKDTLLIEYIKSMDTHPQEEEEEEEEEQEQEKEKKPEIPTVENFLFFCKEEIPNLYTPLEFSLKAKYEAWVADGWRDGNGSKIKNWKTKIKNTIPHLKPLHKSDNPQPIVLSSKFNG